MAAEFEGLQVPDPHDIVPSCSNLAATLGGTLVFVRSPMRAMETLEFESLPGMTVQGPTGAWVCLIPKLLIVTSPRSGGDRSFGATC